MSKYILSFLGLICLILCGCESTGSTAVVSVPEEFGLGETELEDVVLRSGMMLSLQIEVGGKVELEKESLRVGSNGTVVFPIIGQAELEGLTLEEASEELVSRYNTYYVQAPIVRLQFDEDENSATSPWGYVTVLGRVKSPGRVNLPATRDLTASAAIQGAGGFDTSANISAVRITRTSKTGAKPQVVIDMDKLGEGGNAEQDVPLRAGDVVFVPERIF